MHAEIVVGVMSNTCIKVVNKTI